MDTIKYTAGNRNRNHEFYQSTKWKRKRDVIMRHYQYQDQEAKRYGKSVTATMVHHIYPMTMYPELRLVSWNLLPLSTAMHNKFHDRQSDDVIGPGLYWQQKRRREFEKFYASSENILDEK